MANYNPETYCSYPFTGYDNRTKWTCCIRTGEYESFTEKSQSQEIIQLQHDMLNGIKNPVCDTCWMQDATGIVSARSTTLFHKPQAEIEQEIAGKKLKYLWIDSGNVCNLGCRMCGPEFSSALHKEYQARNEVDVKFKLRGQWGLDLESRIKKTNIENLMNEDYSEISEIKIMGGEPFLNLDHLNVLNYIIDNGHSANCTLQYTSNCMIKIPDAIVAILPKFKNVLLNFSVDAVGDRAQYIRTGSNWARINKNMAYVRELQATMPEWQLQVRFSVTTTILNILYIDELFDWIEQQAHLDRHWKGIHLDKFYNIYPLINPDYYSLNVLSDSQRAVVIDRLQQSKFDFSGLITNSQAARFNPESKKILLEEYEWMQAHHDMAVEQYLPELVELLGQ